jgi:hypothetical protein
VDQKKWRTGRLSEEQNSDIYDGFYFISVHALGDSVLEEKLKETVLNRNKHY